MKAILWDGIKQIAGELVLFSSSIEFVMSDFQKSNLELKIKISDIQSLRQIKIYDISASGVEVISIDDRRNVFVVADPGLLIKNIEDLIQSLNSGVM